MKLRQLERLTELYVFHRHGVEVALGIGPGLSVGDFIEEEAGSDVQLFALLDGEIHLVTGLWAPVAETGHLLPDADVVVFEGGGTVEDAGGGMQKSAILNPNSLQVPLFDLFFGRNEKLV